VENSPASEQPRTAPNPATVLDDLAKLQALVDSGMVTVEEAGTLKANIMAPATHVSDQHGERDAADRAPGSYSVMLVDPGPKKIEVIKTVRRLTALGLAEAKVVVDSAPSTVLNDLGELAAIAGAEELRAAGAIVELAKHD
jgi:ribosomal protein L7/L12